MIVAIQTFGDLVNIHPHLHAIVSDGLFAPNGWFYVLPKIDLKKLEELLRHRVLKMLLREGKIDEALIKKLLGWRHSGLALSHTANFEAEFRRNQFPGG